VEVKVKIPISGSNSKELPSVEVKVNIPISGSKSKEFPSVGNRT
jgi:hypothetical protein